MNEPQTSMRFNEMELALIQLALGEAVDQQPPFAAMRRSMEQLVRRFDRQRNKLNSRRLAS